MTYKERLIQLIENSAACPSLLKLPEKCSGLRCKDCRKAAIKKFLEGQKREKERLIQLLVNSMCCPTLLYLPDDFACQTSCKLCRRQAINRFLKGEDKPEWTEKKSKK